MSTKIEIEKYNLDRKTASKLLKVSIRTIDRYVKSKKLSTQIIDGRIWLDKEEIDQLKSRYDRQGIVESVDMSTPKMSIDNYIDKVDGMEVINQDNVDFMSTKNKNSKKMQNAIYKNLYIEIKEEIKEKQERLEIANYRVGQLEAQLKNSMPMLQYHHENYSNKQLEKTLKDKIDEQGFAITKISIKLKQERFNKGIFLLILLIILSLQPLWLLLIYK